MNSLFRIFGTVSAFASKLGLGRLPFAVWMHDTLFKATVPRGVHRYQVEENYFWVDASDMGVGRYLMKGKPFAPEETAVLKKILKPGMTFVDVGANMGYFSVIASTCVGREGKVIAFEPDAANFALLKRNVAENNCTNVVLVESAVSEKSGTASLYRDPENTARHTLLPHDSFKKSDVSTTSLDHYFDPRERIDVIKIDVEGAEPLVLSGMERIMRTQKSLKLIIEFFPSALKKAGYDPEAMLYTLLDAGFYIYQIEGDAKRLPLTREEVVVFAEGKGFKKLVNLLCSREKILW